MSLLHKFIDKDFGIDDRMTEIIYKYFIFKHFREVVKPHRPLLGVDFDPAWNKKIGAVEKTPKPLQ